MGRRPSLTPCVDSVTDVMCCAVLWYKGCRGFHPIRNDVVHINYQLVRQKPESLLGSAVRCRPQFTVRVEFDSRSCGNHEEGCRVHRRGRGRWRLTEADGFTPAVGLGLRVHWPCGGRRVAGMRLYPDDLGALLVQLCCVLLVCLFLALQLLGVMLAASDTQDASKSPLHRTSPRPTSHH